MWVKATLWKNTEVGGGFPLTEMRNMLRSKHDGGSRVKSSLWPLCRRIPGPTKGIRATFKLLTKQRRQYFVGRTGWPNTYCCVATEASEQQHNQDLKQIYKGRRILEFITFYHNALHLTRVHCATNNSTKNTGKWVRECIVRCSDFSLWQIFYSTVRGLTKF